MTQPADTLTLTINREDGGRLKRALQARMRELTTERRRDKLDVNPRDPERRRDVIQRRAEWRAEFIPVRTMLVAVHALLKEPSLQIEEVDADGAETV